MLEFGVGGSVDLLAHGGREEEVPKSHPFLVFKVGLSYVCTDISGRLECDCTCSLCSSSLVVRL